MIIPLTYSHLFNAQDSEPQELWVLTGLLHCRALEAAYETFCARVREFFARSLPGLASTEAESAATLNQSPSG